MNHRTFFDNPDFLEYVRLLSDLHELIRNEADESDGGESLRDRMDVSGGRLSSAEVEGVNAISADFYSLADEQPEDRARPLVALEEDVRTALDARDRGAFGTSLELVRKHGPALDPALLSYVRGTIWAAAGEDRIALPFFRRAAQLVFRRAAQLDPGTAKFAYVLEQSTSRSE